MSASKTTRVLASLLRQTQADEMDCDQFLEWMAAKVDNLLPEEWEPLFAHHRAICPECEEELQALVQAIQVSVTTDPCE